MASPGAAGSIRLDKLLWYLRFARSRSLAQALVIAGHIRLDGRRVTRASCAVHVGQTLVLPVGEHIEVVRLLSLPARRGPPGEAQACYRKLEPETPSAAISAINVNGKAVLPKRAGHPIE
jgi:ribosome-associated heat shock protein Hsp15